MTSVLSLDRHRVVALVALVLLACSGWSVAQCTPSTAYGLCAGPNARASAMRSFLTETNGGCSIGQVAYYPDDNTNVVKCGDCTPGKGGWDDPSRSCELDEYCNDNAKCVPLKDSPFYKAECPMETGTTISFCGAGLRCILKTCVPCQEGAIDYADGKMCVNNMWTYSQWVALHRNPTGLFTVFIFVTVLVGLLIPALYEVWKNEKKKKDKKASTLNGPSTGTSSDYSKVPVS